MGNNFTVRIELEGADRNKYDALHNEMENIGLTRTIDRYGVKYHLPNGEYIGEVMLSGDQLCKKIDDIANNLGVSASALVSAIGNVFILNLHLVKK